MTVLKDRYVAIGVAVMVAFVSFVAVAYAYTHVTNGVTHGLIEHGKPWAMALAPANAWADVEMRHYSPDGSWNRQCHDAGFSYQECDGNWGSLPCQKRSVTGVEGYVSRHWQRRTGCPGTLHP